MKSPVIGQAVIACLASVSLSAEESTADAIRILNILPDYPVERGVKVELKVDVEASLESDYEGMSLIGFNSKSPSRFTMVDRRKLSSGTQQLTYVVKVIPVD